MHSRRIFLTLILLVVLWVLATQTQHRLKPADVVVSGVQGWTSPHAVPSRTLLILKTGIDVAYTRLPVHFNTTFTVFPHHVVYADDDYMVGGMPVIDAIKFLDEETLNDPELEVYRLRRQSRDEHWNWDAQKINVDNAAWKLDRFKNVPALAHAYTHFPDFDWYAMIDDDSYLTAYTLQEVTRDKDPNGLWYLGKSIGAWTRRYAHGGSGIILSRGAMNKMFGSTTESAEAAIRTSAKETLKLCCGDEATSLAFRRECGIDPDTLLQDNELGQFQGNPIWYMHTAFSEWCHPVGVLHTAQPYEIEAMFRWEKDLDGRTANYADFYRDFIMPGVVSEKQGWYVDHENLGLDQTVLKGQEIHNRRLCADACERDTHCTMWQYVEKVECVVFRNVVSQGKAMNKLSPNWQEGWTETTLGYMVDRIQAFRGTQPCDSGAKEEGSWHNLRGPGMMHLTGTSLLD